MENELLAAHQARLANIDSLIGVLDDLGDVGTEITAKTPGGQCLARLICTDVDQTNPVALWLPARHYKVAVAITGADPAKAFAEVLDEVDRLLPPATDTDTAVTIRVASRDVQLVKPLIHHQFSPAVTSAVRRVCPDDANNTAARTRPWQPADRAQLHAAALDLFDWDEKFGAFGNPPARDDLVAYYLDQAMEYPADHRVLIADERGLAGLASLAPPEHSLWITGQVVAAPAAYLGQTWVRADRRGSGIGAVLTGAVHAAAARAGYAAVLLEYLAQNPLSGPFWHRWGYRPLVTTWQRRPAIRISAS